MERHVRDGLFAILCAVGAAAAQGTPQPVEVPATAPAETGAPGDGAQEPTAANDEPQSDFKRFVADLRKAHAPGGEVARPAGFRIGYKLTGQRDGKSLSIVADTTFLRWEKEPGDVRPLIHTRIHEGETPLERGKDSLGEWIRRDGETAALLGNAAKDEREGIQRDINLAEQLLRYLDPAAVVERLVGRSKVTEEEIPIGGRGRTAKCRTVQGNLAEFPFYYRGGEPTPARIQVWIDDETGQLVALEATPYLSRSPTAPPSLIEPLRERYRLSDLEQSGGVLIPTTIVLYRPGPDGKPVYDAKVELGTLDFDVELTAGDLRRPR